ncbi:hypothetical protein GCM10025867_25640 [Frondihabitans sucicola]|uniref:Uncharacterized protein n=1 Tax=Frondihabitans sucicola TaxID=1268041 RepID=A0ABM8GPE5_9MICO|nr:hypothetical protein GCM10025867_25640 [Frondihabitans sucicola]
MRGNVGQPGLRGVDRLAERSVEFAHGRVERRDVEVAQTVRGVREGDLVGDLGEVGRAETVSEVAAEPADVAGGIEEVSDLGDAPRGLGRVCPGSGFAGTRHEEGRDVEGARARGPTGIVDPGLGDVEAVPGLGVPPLIGELQADEAADRVEKCRLVVVRPVGEVLLGVLPEEVAQGL